jgi:hypothetical protein
MSEFLKLEANAPATLGAVVEALTRLSTYPEAELIEASAMPLSGEQHAALIQSSLPKTSTATHESPSGGGRKATKKAFSK